MDKIKELFKNNKTNMVLLCTDGVVIVFMIILLIVRKMPTKPEVTSEKMTESEGISESYQLYDNNLLETFGILIRDTTYTSGDKIFEFGDENIYSGYVNDDNPNVSNWIYSLDLDGTDCILKLYNSDYTESMFYIIDITSDGKLKLINRSDPEDIIVFD